MSSHTLPALDRSPLQRWAYGASIGQFLASSDAAILGTIVQQTYTNIDHLQSLAWQEQLPLLRQALKPFADRGQLYLEFSIPRLGRRIDAVLLIDNVIFVCEFKVGEHLFTSSALDQVWDYALDLKNFHEASHHALIAPLLLATKALPRAIDVVHTAHSDALLCPIRVGEGQLLEAINIVLLQGGSELLDAENWATSRYLPTPTIVEAARALYAGHRVEDISRKEAGSSNLAVTSAEIDEIIALSKQRQQKSICFVTGVPGAGKTLVGLDIATKHNQPDDDLYSVFLSGNGPLVSVLCEALARDMSERQKCSGKSGRKGEARSAVKKFIQNVHHFRDACLLDWERPPIEHVALFDEAQRAWNLDQTRNFMARKKGRADFNMSEPEFLISCLDRHTDWAAVVCLVGGGQEINTGEAGVRTWLEAISHRFPDWHCYVSAHAYAIDAESRALFVALQESGRAHVRDDLHLATSMRSFRAEALSEFVRLLLDLEGKQAREILTSQLNRYPIRITRSLPRAKQWLKQQARGSERYGVVVSSQAMRLKPHAIDVRASVDPIHWFLHEKDDVRSSYYLEDVATEFQVQGLELDWVCVVWDGDLRMNDGNWSHHQFVGDRWQNIKKEDRQRYLVNAYRVLLTRARQGMVIVVPEGDPNDPTRAGHIYDPTYSFLQQLGLPVLAS